MSDLPKTKQLNLNLDADLVDQFRETAARIHGKLGNAMYRAAMTEALTDWIKKQDKKSK